MKMVKSLLLGSAAGLVAVAGAQAADLPVKAKPVEYVKVCSLYGAGFWYVPGTDTCLKIGSFVRVQTSYNNDQTDTPFGAGGNANDAIAGRNTRTDSAPFGFRVRSAVSVDLRTQTEYGTLRSYMDVGAQWSTQGNGVAGSTAATADTLWVDRGFIQFAGFTAGRIRSYFDINSFGPYSYANLRIQSDTGALGIYGIAYTAQLGNGITASLSFEDPGLATGGRGRFTSNLEMASFGLGTTAFDNAGTTFPDVVGALRIDQAWGYAQVSAALHDASGGYYGVLPSATGLPVTGIPTGCGTTPVNCTTTGHPDNALGFAVAGGFTLNDVLGFKGDQFGAMVIYSQGAIGYAMAGKGAWQMYNSGNNAGFGWNTDSVYTLNSDVELTTAWTINGFYQHLWDPRWRTSIYGGYTEVDYNSNAKAFICGAGGAGGAVASPAGFANVGSATATFAMNNVSNCNPDFSFWEVGTRTQWNPHPDLDIGVDVLWTHLNTAYKGTATLVASGARPSGVYTIDDQDVLSVMFRIQRNFLP